MTDDSRRQRRNAPGAMAVVAPALGGFLILLTILSLQMRAGNDPAFKSTATAEPPKTILERRIVETRLIITDAPAPAAGSRSSGAGSAAGAAGQVPASAPAPIVRTAPVQAAPVAPPPPPAPVTRTS